MVWGSISLEGRTDLHVLDSGNLTGARHRDEIIIPIVRPYAGAVGSGFLLLHDNDRPHVCKSASDFRRWRHWHNWLTNMFSGPKNHRAPHGHHGSTHSVASKPTQHSSGAQQRPVWVWQDIDLETMRRLIRSMPRRCRACIQARGGRTRYWCVLSIWLNEWSKFRYKSISRLSLCFSKWFWQSFVNWWSPIRLRQFCSVLLL